MVNINKIEGENISLIAKFKKPIKSDLFRKKKP